MLTLFWVVDLLTVTSVRETEETLVKVGEWKTYGQDGMKTKMR